MLAIPATSTKLTTILLSNAMRYHCCGKAVDHGLTTPDAAGSCRSERLLIPLRPRKCFGLLPRLFASEDRPLRRPLLRHDDDGDGGSFDDGNLSRLKCHASVAVDRLLKSWSVS